MTRRELFAGVGGSVLVTAAAEIPTAIGTANQKSYDLLIRGGRVIDPSQNLDSVRDVGVRQGKIATIAPEIAANQASQVIDATGKMVTPGLIDLHTHVFPYVGPYAIEPDPYFVNRGVTSVIDAGTSGAFTFAAFRRFIIEPAATTGATSEGITATAGRRPSEKALINRGVAAPMFMASKGFWIS